MNTSPLTSAEPKNPQGSHKPLRLAIIEDQPIVVWALRKFFVGQQLAEVVGDAVDVESAAQLIRNHRPDVAIVDLRLERQLAFDLIRDLRTDCPQTAIVVYTAIEGVTYIERCLELGVKGYVSKSQSIDELLTAVRKAAEGISFIDQRSYTELLAKNVSVGKPSIRGQIEKLSPSEMRVFQFIGRGASSAEIAAKLNRSINTIETYRTRIKNKLGLKHASELAYHAFQHSLVTQGVGGV